MSTDARTEAVVQDLARTMGLLHPEAEKQVLAIMWRDREMAIQLTTGRYETEKGDRIEIDENYFSNDLHRLAFLAMREAADAGDQPFNDFQVASLANRIGTARKLKVNVTVNFLRELLDLRPDGTLDGNLSAMRDMNARYNWFHLLHWSIKELRPDTNIQTSVSEFFDRYQHALPKSENERIVYGWEMTDRFLDSLVERRRKRLAGEFVPLDWPWMSWNKLLDPMVPGKFYLFAMPPGHGKSTYRLNIADYYAVTKLHTISVLLEDDPEEDWLRRVARETKIPLRKLQTGEYSEEDGKVIQARAPQLKNLDEYATVINGAGKTVAQMLRDIREASLKIRSRGGQVSAVLLDYLNALAPRNQWIKAHMNPYEMVGQDCDELVRWSNLNRVPIWTADQFNKDGQKQARGGAVYSDLISDSHKKVDCSKAIVLGYRTMFDKETHVGGERFEAGQLSPLINLVVSKQNNGMTGKFMQRMVPGEFRIEEQHYN